jgi:hypothetical protein
VSLATSPPERSAPSRPLTPSGNEADSQTRHLTSQHRLQLAWQLFTALEYQVQVADRKVQAVFGANTLMVAALTLNGQSTLADLRVGGLTPVEVLAIVFRVLLLGSVCTSAASAIMALTPRVRKPNPGSFPPGTAPPTELLPHSRSLFFFGDVCATPVDDFVHGFRELSVEEATDQLLRQVHQVSAVVTEKYRWSRRAASALTCSLMLWIVVLLLRFFS